MDDSAVYDLVFHPGFSTADEVTDTSGRGVGMDVVHDTVSQLDGSVSVDSEPGEGTTVSLRPPGDVAIVKVLFVKVGGDEYGVPIKYVDEITGTEEAQQVNGRKSSSTTTRSSRSSTGRHLRHRGRDSQRRRDARPHPPVRQTGRTPLRSRHPTGGSRCHAATRAAQRD